MFKSKKFYVVLGIVAFLLVAFTAVAAANGELPFEIVFVREGVDEADVGFDSMYYVPELGLYCIEENGETKWCGCPCELGLCPEKTGVPEITKLPRSNPEPTPTDVPTTPTEEPPVTTEPPPTSEPPTPTEEPCDRANPGNDKCVGKAGECPNGNCDQFGWPGNGDKGASNGNKGGNKDKDK